MADSFIRVAIDGIGKAMQTYLNNIADVDVHAEAVVIVDTAGAPINAKVGAANAPVTRGTASVTAATLAVARPTRRGILIRNLDTSLTIYLGPATVTAANGFPLLPGESAPFSWVGLIQVISASGTPAYAVWDEFD